MLSARTATRLGMRLMLLNWSGLYCQIQSSRPERMEVSSVEASATTLTTILPIAGLPLGPAK